MRIVFMGSAAIACETLRMLVHWPELEVVGVITQPDRRVGRKQRLAACPVKECAESLGLTVFTPERVNSTAAMADIRHLRPDVGVVMAYGQILRPALLQIPVHGFLNIHTSLLPRYRGAAPIQRAVANGDESTGVTIMQMDAGMDTGDLLAMESTTIGSTETAGELHDRLAGIGAALMEIVLGDLMQGCIVPQPQPERGVTYAPKLEKREGHIDWTQPTQQIYNHIRGFNPWPCCYCYFDAGKAGRQMLRILEARCLPGGYGVPGEILPHRDAFVVACGEGALALQKVQPQGKAVMAGEAFLRGRQLGPGTVLE